MMRILLCFLFLPIFCLAQIPKPTPGTYVNDYTGSLSVEEIRMLNEQIRSLEDKTTVQLAIVIINDLPNDMSIEDYARQIGNKWKVGVAHNGLVYVAVLHD